MAEFLQSTLRSSVDQLPTDCDDDPLTRLVDQIQVATDDTDTCDQCVIALEECIDEYLRTIPQLVSAHSQTSETWSTNTINHLTSCNSPVEFVAVRHHLVQMSVVVRIKTKYLILAQCHLPYGPAATATVSTRRQQRSKPARRRSRQHSRSTKLAPVAVTTVKSRHSMTSVVAEAPSQSVRDIFLYISFQISKEDAKRAAAGKVEHM